MRTRLAIIAITAALISACGQSPSTNEKITETGTILENIPTENQASQLTTASLKSALGVMQIVSHDGDKEANPNDPFVGDVDWNYKTVSLKSALTKKVSWLETDVIMNNDGVTLYMNHDELCKVKSLTNPNNTDTLNLYTATPAVIDARKCAERFTTQLDSIAGTTGKWMIEVKGDLDKGSKMTLAYRNKVAVAVYNVLNSRNRLNTEIVTAMDVDFLKKFKQLADTDPRGKKAVHLAHVYPLTLTANGINNQPSKLRLDADKLAGFEYASAAVRDWKTLQNGNDFSVVDYAAQIGIQTMAWGWDTNVPFLGGILRNPIEDNKRGVELCVDFMLTEAITDLNNRNRSCPRRSSLPGFNVNDAFVADGPILTGTECVSGNNKLVSGIRFYSYLQKLLTHPVRTLLKITIDGKDFTSEFKDVKGQDFNYKAGEYTQVFGGVTQNPLIAKRIPSLTAGAHVMKLISIYRSTQDINSNSIGRAKTLNFTTVPKAGCP
jgi:glycerophosphoryl diester phosphodiesterase